MARFFAVFLLVGLLLLGVYLSVREGMVAVLWKGVHSNVRLWMMEETSAKLDDWQRVRGFAVDALSWNSHDPQLLQTSAALDWWGSWKYRAKPDFSGRLADSALALYRRSIRARPVWPDGWLYLASVKHWRRQWDEEFQYAYRMAWQYGAWRKSVILRIVELGFDAWKRFTPENREIFYQALRRAALREPVWLRSKATAKNSLFLLCLAVQKDEPTRAYCAKRGYGSP